MSLPKRSTIIIVEAEDQPMLSDEEPATVTLGNVCTKIGSGATPRGGRDVYLQDGPYSLIRSQNVYNDGFRRDGLAYIGEHNADELRNVRVLEDDILLNITGDSVARVCQVPLDVLPARVNQHVLIIRPDRAIIDPQFLRYYLVSPGIQELLLSWAGSGGTRNALTKRMIESLELHIPPLDEQRRIAHILGTLDDKIELNRRMNATLEEMARAVFKDWFVDFGPVRAKMAGREAYLPADVWALFPERLGDDGLPEGWEMGVLDDAIELLSGGTPRTSIAEYWNGDIPWYTAKDAPSESDVFVVDTERKITQAGIDSSPAKMLSAGTTIISARGTVGRLACLGKPMTMNQTCYGIRGANGYPDYFTYWNIKTAVHELQQRTHGTIFDTITRQTFKQVNSVIPPLEVAVEFEKEVLPYMRGILINLHESRTLAALRDTMLPGLVSGEVQV